MTEVEFFKYEGTGNDFVLIDEFNGTKIKDKRSFAKRVCMRSYGVGSDGVLYVLRSNKGLPLMHMYNPDGSGPDMCGNGIRCVALHCLNKGYVNGKGIVIDTNVGEKKLEVFGVVSSQQKSKRFIEKAEIKVCMGKVSFEPSDVPVLSKDEFIQKKIRAGGMEFIATAASIGNPHLLIIEEDIGKVDKILNTIGPLLENHKIFPERINVHFAQLIKHKMIKLITWERGAGRTKACGTGATTSVAILHRLGKVGLPCTVYVPGGELVISKKGDNWYMKGYAKYVFRGFVNV